MSARKPGKGRGAFSLLEILVAVACLAGIMAPLLSMATGQAAQASQSMFLQQAHGLLLHRIREKEAGLHASRFAPEALEPMTRSVTTTWGGRAVAIEEEVRVTPTGSTPGTFLVEAKVNWRESRGVAVVRCSHELSHLVCDPSLGQEAKP